MECDYIAFIDVDEISGRNWLATAFNVLAFENADCVGGRINVSLFKAFAAKSDLLTVLTGTNVE